MAIAFLTVLGLGAVFFGFFSFKRSLSKPFEFKIAQEPKASSETCPGGDCPDAREENSKLKDTDKDGLSDWDELNIHNTSPYLKDTDSDGVDDLTELESGTDPYCLGQDCGAGKLLNKEDAEGAVSRSKPPEGSDQPEPNKLDMDFNIKDGDASEDERLKVIQGEGDADSLRRMLERSGISQQLLDQVSDEELMELYQEQLKAYSGQ